MTGYRVDPAAVDAPWLEEPRSVPLNLWYPTDASTGESASYIELFVDELALVDAPVRAPACKMPLVVYSHGSQGWGGSGSPLLRHLVSQGWLAAAPDHVDNTLLDNVDPRPISFSATRVADVVAAIDHLEELPADDPLAGRVDTSKVLVVGHSFGGQTAWLLAGPTPDLAAIEARCDADVLGCSEAERAAFAQPFGDDRVVALVPMDGAAGTDLVAAAGWATATLPIFYMNRSGEGDSDAFDQSASAPDVGWARFEGACHETFTSTDLPCDFDKEEGLDLAAAYLTAQGAVSVLGADDSMYTELLSGQTTIDPRVTVRRR